MSYLLAEVAQAASKCNPELRLPQDAPLLTEARRPVARVVPLLDESPVPANVPWEPGAAARYAILGLSFGIKRRDGANLLPRFFFARV
jgi:hypothetical protein